VPSCECCCERKIENDDEGSSNEQIESTIVLGACGSQQDTIFNQSLRKNCIKYDIMHVFFYTISDHHPNSSQRAKFTKFMAFLQYAHTRIK